MFNWLIRVRRQRKEFSSTEYKRARWLLLMELSFTLTVVVIVVIMLKVFVFG